MNKNSKIYVAGHLGLVGSAITKNLKDKGYTNIIGKSFKELDLTDTRAVNKFFELERPEYVILAAAKVGGIAANNTYRGEFIYENLMIQNNVIHAAYLYKVIKLLFLGSTCIYPRNAPQPMDEECLLTSPLEYTNEPYAIAKIAGVKLCESYNLQYGTNFMSVMPTNLYGPNDNFDLEKSHVLPGMLRKIYLGKCLEEGNWDAIGQDLNKRPIEGITGKENLTILDEGTENQNSWENKVISLLAKYGIRFTSGCNIPDIDPDKSDRQVYPVTIELWGTGTPMREFLWSEEMADACVFLLENVEFQDIANYRREFIPESIKTAIPEIRNTHINIGTGNEISTRQLAVLIKEKVGFRGEIIFDSSRPDGTMRKLTNPTKLHALGWHHQVEIEEGIVKLYDWYLHQN
jgi:GDP-L-fucose synthase